MLKSLYKATVFLMGLIFLCVACTEDEQTYSCNPETNNWVTENKDKYANISRDELAKFDPDKQLGLFRSFSPDQKVYLYKEKYHYLMKSNDLSIDEKLHLSKLYDSATPEIYTSAEEKQRFNMFAQEWVNEAKDLLGWGDKEIYLYTHTYLTVEEFNEVAKIDF
jgi:hypothetical protein